MIVFTTETTDGDIDLVAIERAINGDPVPLTLAEKVYAARLLDSHGYDLTEIGKRIRSDSTTIAGWKSNGWQPGGPKPAPKPKRQPPVCGERRMYHQHLRRGEKPCDACRAANTEADRRYRLTGSSATAA